MSSRSSKRRICFKSLVQVSAPIGVFAQVWPDVLPDIVERFQLALMLGVIAIRNYIELGGSEATSLPKAFAITSSKVETIFHPVLLVMASEVIVDWLKHAFITKFNHIRPSVYNRFVDVLCQDFIPAGAHPVSRICQTLFRTTHRL